MEQNTHKCGICGSTEDLREKQMPGFGIKGGIFLCKEHDDKLNEQLKKIMKPKSPRPTQPPDVLDS